MNNELINPENGNLLPKKRGRPKGSGKKGSRPDKAAVMAVQAEPGTGNNRHILQYSVALSRLPKIDYNSLPQVQNRIDTFFAISEEFDIKPAVASLALSLGIDRATLFNWLTRRTQTIKSQECFDAIKTAYNLINSQYEIYMNTGKINPVAGIFLMKNNMGYQDTTNYVVSTDNSKELSLQDITDRSGLLDD